VVGPSTRALSHQKPNSDALRRSTSAPQPLSFGFELPASAGPSSSTSDPFLPSRTRARPVRSRPLGRVQSQSQNDVLAIPAADASKFLDMLGRASARVDENSRKRMRAREGDVGDERARAQRSSRKGKERMRAATVMVTRSMDELGDQTNLRQDVDLAEQVHYSSLPIMQSKHMLSQEDGSTTMQWIRAADKKDNDNDVHMHGPDADAHSPASGDAIIIEPPVSTRPQNVTNHRPPSSSTTATTTKHSRKKRLQPPSPTPIRPSPTPIALRAPVGSQPAAANKPSATRTSTSPPKPSQGLALALPASQAHGSKRALGMTRSVPRAASANNAPHSAAVKKPFRPPLARATQPVGAAAVTTSPRDSKPTRQRQADDGTSAAADPDSSFDLSFDFDPDALEAAMKKYD